MDNDHCFSHRYHDYHVWAFDLLTLTVFLKVAGESSALAFYTVTLYER